MNSEIVKKYIKNVEALTLENVADEILHPDYIQVELPNALNKSGQKSNLNETLQRMQFAKKLLVSQKFEILKMYDHGQTIIIECSWTGKLAISAGPLKEGQEMKAQMCMFIDFLDHKIHRVRNYDCFEPF